MNFKPNFFNPFLIFVFLIFVDYLYPQEIDLVTYIDLVKNNNIDLKQGDKKAKIAREEFKIAKSLVLPNASAESFYQRDFNKNFLFINDEFDGSTTAFRTNFNNTIDASVTVTQTIFDPTVFSAVKVAKLTEELHKLENENMSNKLVIEASKLYWKAVFIKESIKVLNENAKLAKEQVDQIKKIANKGVVSKLQLYQAEGLYKKTILVLNNTKNQHYNILNELKVLANISITENLFLTESLENFEINGISSMKDIVIGNQPEIKTLKKEIEISEKQINANKKFWYPKLNIVTGYNYNVQDNGLKFGNHENKLFFGQLRITFPIFSGGRNNAEIVKTKIEKEAVELHLKNKQQEFLKQLQNAQNSYNTTINNIAIRRETLRLNEKEIVVFKKQLRLGVVTPIEFKEVLFRLTQSKLDLLSDYLDLHIAQLQIKRILGTAI
ncbi:TolC family protein [uncultured Maribacter sp.]|uniref:TolC family protein n=1 Tax=uncultured Maribacter sp. TaxID=431308 RepID=UPI0026139970|nr:TolC family protein [uncultured Maribacter sp.]